MNLKSLAQRLPFGRSSILVCETDGFHLRGAVISRDGEDLKVELSASTQASDYRAAIQELVGRLREQGWTGKQAILLTPAVYSALVELPVAPKQKRPALQMQELIRWELEPLLMQHHMSFSIGQMLLGLGYMTEAQIADVLDYQQGRRKDEGAGGNRNQGYSTRRFGELALELGFVNRERLEEALTRQAWLRSENENYGYGWVAQTPAHGDMQDDSGDGIHYWLVSGANQGMMRQWESAFAELKIDLSHVYPQTGCAAALLDTVDDAILLEAHGRLVSGMRLQAGAVTALKLQPSSTDTEMAVCAEMYQGMVPPEPRQIWLTAPPARAAGLNAGLHSIIGREVLVQPEHDAVATPGMMGAARDVLGLSGAGRCCSVSTRGPQPPVWQRVEARAIAAGVFLLLALVVAETVLQVRHDIAQTQYKKTAAEKRMFDQAVAQVQAQVDAAKKVEDEIKAKEEEIEKLTTQFDFFAMELPGRSAFLQTLLKVLTETVTEDVVIDVIEETPNLGFRISAWALNESAAQKFIQTFKDAMYPWGGDVTDPIVREQTGRMGLLGYNIHFRLVQFEPGPELADTPATFE